MSSTPDETIMKAEGLTRRFRAGSGAFGGGREATNRRHKPAGQAERQKTVEQGFDIGAEQTFVMGLADTEIEGGQSARAALAHELGEQLLARAFGLETVGHYGIEHAAKTAAADDSAHGRHDDVVGDGDRRFDGPAPLSLGFRPRCDLTS